MRTMARPDRLESDFHSRKHSSTRSTSALYRPTRERATNREVARGNDWAPPTPHERCCDSSPANLHARPLARAGEFSIARELRRIPRSQAGVEARDCRAEKSL